MVLPSAAQCRRDDGEGPRGKVAAGSAAVPRTAIGSGALVMETAVAELIGLRREIADWMERYQQGGQQLVCCLCNGCFEWPPLVSE